MLGKKDLMDQYSTVSHLYQFHNDLHSPVEMITSFNHSIGYILPNNEAVHYRLRARNVVGWGAYSTVTTVTCDRKPTRMNVPVIDTENVHPQWIMVTWTPITALADTGRDPPTYY